MEFSSTFRWILIIAGVAILAGIFLLGNPEKKRRRASRRRISGAKRREAPAARREPTLGESETPGRFDEDLPEGGQGELAIEPTADATPEPESPAGPAPDKIVALYLQARDNHLITGLDLLDAALKSGMEFGRQDIFHRIQEGADQPIFSMASLTPPGTFDKSSWNTLETKGVTMFLTLPGPVPALDAWDKMLATSRRLCELLHADLLDDAQSTFTRQREGLVRQELRDYERSQRPEE